MDTGSALDAMIAILLLSIVLVIAINQLQGIEKSLQSGYDLREKATSISSVKFSEIEDIKLKAGEVALMVAIADRYQPTTGIAIQGKNGEAMYIDTLAAEMIPREIRMSNICLFLEENIENGSLKADMITTSYLNNKGITLFKYYEQPE